MRYFAGKSKIAPHIEFAIMSHTNRRLRYFEPFVGGGGTLERMSGRFLVTYASDTHRDLIMMWQALMEGWEPPSNVTQDEFKALKNAPTSALRGFVGFGCAFGGKWFAPYARFTNMKTGKPQNFADESRRNLANCLSLLSRECTFHLHSYEKTPVTSDAVVYCDPPYNGTYSYSPFDTAKFWKWCESMVELGAHVYVSEYEAPSGWVTLWEKERAVMFRMSKGKRQMERLFVHESQREKHPGPLLGQS